MGDEATARPWRIDGDGRIVGPNPDETTDEILIADTAPGNVALTEYDEANARLIVSAVNQHSKLLRDRAALLTALKEIAESPALTKRYTLKQIARAAIAQAENS